MKLVNAHWPGLFLHEMRLSGFGLTWLLRGSKLSLRRKIRNRSKERMILQQTWAELRTQLITAIPAMRGYFPLFYIWGFQWMIQAMLGLLDDGSYPGWLSVLVIAIAAVLSLYILWTAGKPKQPVQISWTSLKWFVFPYLLFAVIALILFYSEVVSRHFFPLFQGMVLALFYIKTSLILGRVFLFMALWLLSLSFVIAWAYLGFMPFVISFMGGCSLIVCGWLLTVRSRQGQS